MTQPLMTNLIEAKRSVRRLYTEALVGRGDITEEEYEQAKRDFQNRLEIAFAETHAAETGTSPVVDADAAAEPAVRRARDHRCLARDRAPDRRRVRQQARRLHGARQAAAAARQAPRHEPQRRDRLGLRRAARLRLAAARGHAVRLAGPGLAPRHVRPAPLRAARSRERPGVDPARRTSATTRAGSGSTTRCSASTPRWRSSTATRSSAPTRSCCGRRSSATSPTAPSPSRRVHLLGRAEVGPAVERRAAAPARLRGSGTRPLVGAHRALPADVRAGQHDRRAPVDARVVLPPAAPSGVRAPAPSAHRLHPEGHAAPARRDEPGRGLPHAASSSRCSTTTAASTAPPSSACCCTPARSTGI